MVDDKIQAAIAFFEQNGHRARQLVSRGRKRGLKESRVLEGMVSVHQRCLDGEPLRPINMAWEAWEEAGHCHDAEYVNWCRSRGEYAAQIDQLERRLSTVNGAFWGMAAILLSTIILCGWINHV